MEQERLLETSLHRRGNRIEYSLEDLVLSDTCNVEMLQYLNTAYNIKQNQKLLLIIVYINDNPQQNIEEIKKPIIRRLDSERDFNYHCINLNVYRELVFLVQPGADNTDEGALGQNTLLEQIFEDIVGNAVLGVIDFYGLDNFKSSLNVLRKELKWSITFGDRAIIDHSRLRQVRTELIKYPVDIENSIKTAIYSRDSTKILACVNEFLSLWQKKIYIPDHIIDSFIRFASTMLNAVKDIDRELYNTINQKEKLKLIIDSITWKEIKNALIEISDIIILKCKDDDKPYSLVVKKALNIVHQDYMESISLQDTASRLGITPEYLSHVFKNEVGKSFIKYIKEFRIGKAKSLLIDTDLKEYTIAQKVGYSDPKYFYRVFKDISGMSPGDYRKANK